MNGPHPSLFLCVFFLSFIYIFQLSHILLAIKSFFIVMSSLLGGHLIVSFCYLFGFLLFFLLALYR